MAKRRKGDDGDSLAAAAHVVVVAALVVVGLAQLVAGFALVVGKPPNEVLHPAARKAADGLLPHMPFQGPRPVGLVIG